MRCGSTDVKKGGFQVTDVWEGSAGGWRGRAFEYVCRVVRMNSEDGGWELGF